MKNSILITTLKNSSDNPSILTCNGFQDYKITTPLPSFALNLSSYLFDFTAYFPKQILLPTQNPKNEHLLSPFTENLWMGDVAEFFWGPKGGHEYHEINLGINGAWWYCSFKSYRERKNYPPKIISVTTADIINTETLITIKLSIPLHQLDSIPSENDLGNVCFILSKEEKKYFSFAPLPGDKPDFHKLETFLPIKIV